MVQLVAVALGALVVQGRAHFVEAVFRLHREIAMLALFKRHDRRGGAAERMRLGGSEGPGVLDAAADVGLGREHLRVPWGV